MRYEKPKRLLAVESVHTTSRLAKDRDTQGIPDPQLHSHVAVIAAERKDGQVAAVESKQLFRAARENGAWYRAELAENLKSLGLPIERRTGNGERYFEIKGVTTELAEHWSTRSQDVDRAAQTFRQRYGREPQAGELDSLTLATRGSKSAATPADVNAAWRALGAEHNQTQQRSEELFNDWGLHNQPKVDLDEGVARRGHARQRDSHRSANCARRHTSCPPASPAPPTQTASLTTSRAPASCCSWRTARGQRNSSASRSKPRSRSPSAARVSTPRPSARTR